MAYRSIGVAKPSDEGDAVASGEFSNMLVQIGDSEIEKCRSGSLRIVKDLKPRPVSNPPLDQSLHRVIVFWTPQ